MKLLLQPLKKQDPGGRQLCLLDFLATLKPVRQGIIHTILSRMVDISCPEAAQAALPMGQLPAKIAETAKPAATEPRAIEASTEGAQNTTAQIQPPVAKY